MSLSMAGIDYNRAGVDVRSRFAFGRAEMNSALERLQQTEGVTGSVLLSTCNRTELWISTSSSPGAAEKGAAEVKHLLCRLKGVSYEDNREYLYALHEEDAVDHLFRLAGGLESRILGEDQIISQVKDALGKSRENFAADHVLEVLFRQAVTAGKRVKTKVNLSTADRSVIHQAIQVLKSRNIDLREKQCLVIGNGMMGKLAAAALRDAGAFVTVTVRQYHNGMVEVPAGCERIDYETRYAHIAEKHYDLIVSATSSPNLTLQAEPLQAACGKERELLLIDLAVPRDIEPACGSLPGTQMFDIDSFESLPDNAALRENVRKAEGILAEEKEEFFKYYEGRDLLPMIAEIKQAAAADMNARLKPVYKKLAGEAEWRTALEQESEGAAERMMNKLLFSMQDYLDAEHYRACLQAMHAVLRPETEKEKSRHE